MEWFPTAASATSPFCPKCKNVLPFPDTVGSKTKCTVCKGSFPAPEHSKPVITRSLIEREKNVRKIFADSALIMDGSVLCPECEHNEISFKTAQLRSADEGQTIFYECRKCSHTWSVNA